MIKKLLLALIMLSMSVPAAVQALEKGYLGFIAGVMEIDDPIYEPAMNVGLIIGGVVTKRDSVSLAIEALLTTKLLEGNTSSSVLDEWEIDTLGLYGALRLGRSAFFKLKAGYGKWQIATDVATTDESDFTWGVGFGLPLRTGKVLEVEYAIIGKTNGRDIRYISLNYLF